METLKQIKKNLTEQFSMVYAINVLTGKSPITDMDLFEFMDERFQRIQSGEKTLLILFNGKVIYSCAGFQYQEEEGEPNRIILYTPKQDVAALKEISKVFHKAGFYVTSIKTMKLK